MLLNYGAGEDSWESLGQQGDQTSLSPRKSTLNIHWQDWCWSWSSSTSAKSDVKSWLIEKDPDSGKDWGQEEKEGDRGGDDWMALRTAQTWVWANSGRWWRIGNPGRLQFMGSQSLTWLSYLNNAWLHFQDQKDMYVLLLPYLFGIVPQRWNVISPAIVPSKLPE